MIDKPPIRPKVVMRRGDLASQLRARPAARAHAVSVISPINSGTIPRIRIWAVALPAEGAMNCGTTAVKSTKLLGLVRPTIVPARTAAKGVSTRVGGFWRVGYAARVPERLESQPEQVEDACPLDGLEEHFRAFQQRTETKGNGDPNQVAADGVARHWPRHSRGRG